eukprot:42376_1
MSTKNAKISGKKRSRDDCECSDEENELNINHKKRKTESVLNQKINEMEELEREKQTQINVVEKKYKKEISKYEKQIGKLQAKIAELNEKRKQERMQIASPFDSQIGKVSEDIELWMQETEKNGNSDKPLFCRICYTTSDEEKIEICTICKIGICESCCDDNRCSGIDCETVTCDDCKDGEFETMKCGALCCETNECPIYHYKDCLCQREVINPW